MTQLGAIDYGRRGDLGQEDSITRFLCAGNGRGDNGVRLLLGEAREIGGELVARKGPRTIKSGGAEPAAREKYVDLVVRRVEEDIRFSVSGVLKRGTGDFGVDGSAFEQQ